MTPESIQYKISRIPRVTTCQILNRGEMKCIEFTIGSEPQFPSGRVAKSRIIFTEDGSSVRDGTIRMCVDQKQFTGTGDSLAQQITADIKVSVIDSVLHIYLIGPNPLADSAPEHANIDPTTCLQIIRFISNLDRPVTEAPRKLEQKFGGN